MAFFLWGMTINGSSGTLAVVRASATRPAPDMTALFAEPSYSPGQVAQLRVVADATRLTVQPITAFSKSDNPYAPITQDPPVGPSRTVAWHPGAGTLAVPIGRWASGVYFIRVRSAGGQVVAPVVVRAGQFDHSSVAVIAPTDTWQAYNRRGGDTWYACSCVHTVDLERPYLDGGVPYNFGQYDRGFFQWLARNNIRADVLADDDLDQIATGAELRRLYRTVVFESHSEYATGHMFDVIQQYRDLGGHVAFLSANDFFREVVVSDNSMTLIGRFRDLGRPEAALLGAQYLDWYRNIYPSRPYRVVGAGRVPWLFAGTRLHDGSLIPGFYGIEIDGTTSASPPGTTVVATIPNIFPGETADMTYYTTGSGAEVFDAGTIDFGGSADNPDVATMLTNLWTHMSGTALPPSELQGAFTGTHDRLPERMTLSYWSSKVASAALEERTVSCTPALNGHMSFHSLFVTPRPKRGTYFYYDHLRSQGREAKVGKALGAWSFSLAGHMTSTVGLQITVSQLSFAGDYLTPAPPSMPSGSVGVVPVSCTAPDFTVELRYLPLLAGT